VWSLADAAYWTKQGLWPTQGNTLAVEDVFSTWLYTGTGAAQTITNNINLSGSGGMVWLKRRSGVANNQLYDTVRGVGNKLASNTTTAQASEPLGLTAFSSTGFSLGSDNNANASGTTNASWTFREQPNFFDVVTYTGNGVAGRQIAHNLGVAPGMMIVKCTSAVDNWNVYHRSLGGTQRLTLNLDQATVSDPNAWNNTDPTSSVFTVGNNSAVNSNGATYVAYLYAHVTASDGIIQCGSFTTDGSGNVGTVTLGWEPQWVLFKRTNGAASWITLDNMRGFSQTGQNVLNPNNSDAENVVPGLPYCFPTATGFSGTGNFFGMNVNMVYMAIRRGPMKTPTLGTSVFAPVATNATNNPQSGFPLDLWWLKARNGVELHVIMDRMRGTGKYLSSDSTAAEGNNPANYYRIDNMTGGFSNGGTFTEYIHWIFRRAPGFFDEVCYTGTGANRTVAHNLGVAPELMIVKSRTQTEDWWVYSAATGAANALYLNGAGGQFPFASVWNSTSPTASVFSLGTLATVNNSGSTYVAYLFASCPGVSKVGTYTGNGSSQTINCAFTTGARFVLIKRTDSTGAWYVWDSARGIVAGNDPYLALNTTAAEVTSNDSVDTDSTGFIVNQVAASNVNVNAATYIFLAIA
jgi:hypothetical protein